MRPLRLLIKGFGTYLQEQDLDFTLLNDQNIFVVTGDTGAGKTTIFDAMNYALYGEASGKDREGISFRSDFATPEEETRVELWFALRGEDYYIRREPSYMEKKLRGEGEKEHKAYAELKLPGGKIITGIKPVTLEVERLLGINKEQFRQIVMIPQGEFKKLLTADSQDREKIFRKIFGTEVFEQIKDRVNTEANELDKTVRLKRNERDTKLKSLECKEIDEILFRMLQTENIHVEEVLKRAEDMIKEDIKLKQEVDRQVKALEEAIEKLNKAFVQGENINKQFEELKTSKEQLILLEGKTTAHQTQKLALTKARKALTLKGFEENWVAKNISFKAQNEALQVTKKAYQEAKTHTEQALKELQLQQNKQIQTKEKEQILHETKKLQVKAKQYEEIYLTTIHLKKEQDKFSETLQTYQLTIQKDEDTLQNIQKDLEQITLFEKQKLQLEARLKELHIKEEDFSHFKNFVESLKHKEEEHTLLQQTFSSIDIRFQKAKEEYEILEESFRRGQAGILAQTLIQNKPCPVCGALQHPSPAILLDKTINEQAVDKARDTYEKIRLQKEACFNQLTQLYSNITLIGEQTLKPLVRKYLEIEDLTKLQLIQVEFDDLDKANKLLIQQNRQELKQLEVNIANKDSYEALKTTLSQKLIRDKEQLKTNTDMLTLKQVEYGTSFEKLKLIEEEFKGQVKSYEEITLEIEALGMQLKTLEKDYKDAEHNYHEASKALSEQDGRLKTITQHIKVLEEEREEAAKVFKEQTLALGFEDYKDYKVSCMTEGEIELLDQQLLHFEKKLEGAKQLYQRLEESTKSLQPVDLVAIEKDLQAKNKDKLEQNKIQQIVFARIQNNDRILKEAKVLHEQIQQDENKYQIVGELAKVMKGDNEYRVSFERYVLAAYFEDIVEASNVRFAQMTGGRFELLRKTQKGDARTQQGLDLEVMDNYTGKARSIETLSGGESFKASLSMALGLADVVQSYAGGIQLDTMFVDEGFGTLDPESLESAINCLVGLQDSGRLVGVISHVPELKERIQARLEVVRIARGSKVVFKV